MGLGGRSSPVFYRASSWSLEVKIANLSQREGVSLDPNHVIVINRGANWLFMCTDVE